MQEATFRILLLEDDFSLHAVMRDYLALHHYHVEEVDSIEACWLALDAGHHHLLLLDLNLPDGDGLELLERLREASDVPVFVISGRIDDESRLRALEAGADDYLAKPFNARELELRIRNFLRRNQGSGTASTERIAIGEGELRLQEYRLSGKDGTLVQLTAAERDMLLTLASAEGRLCSRRQLARACGDNHQMISDESITVIIYRLRRKLATADLGATITTVSGAGYRIEQPVSRPEG